MIRDLLGRVGEITQRFGVLHDTGDFGHDCVGCDERYVQASLYCLLLDIEHIHAYSKRIEDEPDPGPNPSADKLRMMADRHFNMLSRAAIVKTSIDPIRKHLLELGEPDLEKALEIIDKYAKKQFDYHSGGGK